MQGLSTFRAGPRRSPAMPSQTMWPRNMVVPSTTLKAVLWSRQSQVSMHMWSRTRQRTRTRHVNIPLVTALLGIIVAVLGCHLPPCHRRHCCAGLSVRWACALATAHIWPIMHVYNEGNILSACRCHTSCLPVCTATDSIKICLCPKYVKIVCMVCPQCSMPRCQLPASSSVAQLAKTKTPLPLCHAGFTSEGFLWAALAPGLAHAAGTCSYFNSSADTFEGNQAAAAGAVIFSTDAKSTGIYCTNGTAPKDHKDCPGWGTTALNMLGAVGYGPGLAFPAASILLDGNPDYNTTLSYISDGVTKLTLPTVTVLDQAQHSVILPGLTASLTILNNTVPGLASLPSQTQASGSNGSISFSSVVLAAVPGAWQLQVALSSYSAVSPQLTHAHLNSARGNMPASCSVNVFHSLSLQESPYLFQS